MSKPVDRQRTIQQFVRTTRFQRRLWFGVASLASHGIVVGAALYLIDWALPDYRAVALWVGLGWLTVVLAWHLLCPGLSLRAADGVLGLQDRLRTWWSLRERREQDAYRWLEADLSDSLTGLPPGARARLWRRPARRLLWALPLLLVVWLIGPLGWRAFLPSAVGVQQPGERGPVARAESDPGARPGAGGAPRQPKRPVPPDPHQPEDPAHQPDRSKPDPQPPPPPPSRPEPIVPLPGAEEFVIPAFVEDGDGKLTRTRVAVIEEGRGGAGQRTGADQAGGAAAAEQAARAREYQLAEERALRSRHVPEQERGFVKRYFEELLRQPAAGKAPRRP